jgi:hypothetical protein
MTVVLPISRSLAKQLLARTARSLTRPVSTKPLIRVDYNGSSEGHQPNTPSGSDKLASLFRHARTYATAAAKPASRPKQHTGRTPAKRTSTTTKKATPAKKPASKRPKRKTKKVAKPKVKKPKKAPTKTSLALKARKERDDLKAKALLAEPKRLVDQAFLLIVAEETKGSGGRAGLASAAAAASNKYKNLTLEEREVRANMSYLYKMTKADISQY